MDSVELSEARILICDDQEANVLLLEQLLRSAGYVNIERTTEGKRAVELYAQSPPDLLLLDLHMPDLDGFEVMRLIGLLPETSWVPVLVLTSDMEAETKQRALSAGGKDFLTKPFDHAEVLIRVQNLLEARFLQLELRQQNCRLESAVQDRTRDLEERTRDLEERTHELEEARFEMLERLALAAEYRDDATGEHVRRVGRNAALLYDALGRSQDEVELVASAATLHDVGKIGISDSILLKRGRLTPAEYQEMQHHVELSRRILAGSRSPLLGLSEEIARFHHEKWDGSGYPSGLRGERIPLAGRVVAIADVFDVLTHERPYKPAWPVDEAVTEIISQSGRHFDPHLVEAFATLDHPRLLEPATPPGSRRFQARERSRVPAP